MLAEFAMPDGSTVLRLATQDLTPSGFQYNGNPYLPRILNQDMAAFQLLSQQGVSVPPNRERSPTSALRLSRRRKPF